MFDYNAIIIGGGPGGYTCAIRIAQLGGKACVIENRDAGGTCLNRGCIPTKALLASTEVVSKFRKAKDFGIDVSGFTPNFTAMMQRKDSIVKRLRMGVEYLLKNNGVEFIRGTAKITAPHQVEVVQGSEKKSLSAENIVVATGSVPAKIPGVECNASSVITSDELLFVPSLSKSLLIIGGGVIGCEFACIFSELGTSVTVVEMLEQILPTEDEEIASSFRKILEKRGIKIYTGTRVDTVDSQQPAVRSKLSNGEETETEKVLVCTGRKPNSAGLGLEDAGVKTEGARIITDEKMRTGVEGIYAIGDVTSRWLLAHVAMTEGTVAAENIMGRDSVMDYSAVPGCIFTSPEIGSVGLTEKKARESREDVVVGKFPFTASGKAMACAETEGFVKIVAGKNGDVLGVHILGPQATNLVPEAVLAVKNGIKIKDVMSTIHAHPTLSEAVHEAVLDTAGEAIHIPAKKRV